jgi:aminoglycoside N3'-acetyltransferase
MTRYTLQELANALRRVGLTEGQTLFVHSSLVSFGLMDGFTPTDVVPRVYQVLRDIVGSAGTIVVPAFNFDFCKGTIFDPATTPSKGMGALSEFVRTRPEAFRSPHPMQSVAAVGRLAQAICRTDTASSFDPGGPFSVMLEYGACALLLGAPMQSVSFVHLAEERCKVPYRYWKCFTAPYGSPPLVKSYRMYVRHLESDPQLILQRIENVMSDHGLMALARVGAGTVRFFRLPDFIAVTIERLAANPNWLIEA